MSKELYILAFEKNEKDIFYVHRSIRQKEIFPTDEMVPFDALLDENKAKTPRFFTAKPEAQRAINAIDYSSFDCEMTGLKDEEVMSKLKPRKFVLL